MPRNRSIFPYIWAVGLWGLLFSCTEKSSQNKKDHSEKKAIIAGKKGEKITQDQTEKKKKKRSAYVVPVLADSFKKGTITSYYTTYTALESLESATIISQTSAYIKAIKSQEGDWVKPGNLLVQLDAEQETADLRLQTIYLEKAKSDLEHQSRLMERQLISQDDLLKAQLNVEACKVKQLVAQQALNLKQLRSPIKGIVTDMQIKAANFLTAGQTVATIVNPLIQQAIIHVPEKEGLAFKIGAAVQITANQVEQLTGAARITRISPVVDSKSGTLKITITLDNHLLTFKHGQFVKLNIVKGVRQEAILLPRKAVAYVEGKRYFYKAIPFSGEERNDLLAEIKAAWEMKYEHKNGAPEAGGEPVPAKPEQLAENIYKAKKVLLFQGLTNEQYIEVLKMAVSGEFYLREGFEGLIDGSTIELINMAELIKYHPAPL